MALGRSARRAIAKQRQAAKQERFDRRIEAARSERNREIVKANQAAPKEREYMPNACRLGTLGAEQLGGGAHVFGSRVVGGVIIQRKQTKRWATN